MKHITKKQFLEHGWRKGDRVKAVIFYNERIERVTDAHVENCAVTVAYKDSNGDERLYWIKYADILEIIPRKERK